MQQYFVPALFAFALTVGLLLLALRVFPKWGLMDRPEKYRLKRKPIPYYGGLILYVSFVVSTLIFVPIDRSLVMFLVAATLLLVVSFIDDWKDLSPWLRLGVQLIAALLLVFGGIGIMSLSNPLGDPLLLDQWKFMVTLDQAYEIAVWSALFTVVWVVMMVNTMNFLDGLHGLPSGITAIAGLTLFALSIRPDIHVDASSQVAVATMSLILFAVAAGFWFFDFYPAKILMGDTGSVFLGFVLATLAIFSGGKVATAFLVMGFPILDAGWVIMRRIVQGKSPMKGDLKHLHHRLLETGLSHREAVLCIYLLCAVFGGIAVLLEGVYKLYALVILLVLMVIVGSVAVHVARNRNGS